MEQKVILCYDYILNIQGSRQWLLRYVKLLSLIFKGSLTIFFFPKPRNLSKMLQLNYWLNGDFEVRVHVLCFQSVIIIFIIIIIYWFLRICLLIHYMQKHTANPPHSCLTEQVSWNIDFLQWMLIPSALALLIFSMLLLQELMFTATHSTQISHNFHAKKLHGILDFVAWSESSLPFTPRVL